MIQKLLITLLLLFSLHLSAAEKIRSYQVITTHKKMLQVAGHFEVVKKLKKGFEVYVKEEDVQQLLKIVPKAKLLEKDIHSLFSNENEKSLGLSQYRKYADVEKDLVAMSSTYKDLTSLETYGVTKAGRKLYALKISSSKVQGLKPKLMITAATHGDELITVEVLFALMNELLSGYGQEARLTQMLDKREIYFIPVVSPDSFEARERYVQGLDPNRSFPWPENIKNKTVDCIQSLMDFSNSHGFSGSLDLHAYGKLVMFPWGYTTNPPNGKDEVLFTDLVSSMARENQYTAGQISTTIYVAKGSSADYFYWKNQTQAIAAELSNQKIPSYSSIPSVVDEAREMVWTFIEHFN